MQMVWIVMMFIALIGAKGLLANVGAPDRTSIQEAAEANNMLIYNAAVVTYVTAHPTVSGTIPDASLSFSTGYVNSYGWTNSADGAGTVYTYPASLSTLPSKRIEGELAVQTNGSYNAGYVRSNKFYTTADGYNASVTVPGAVPDTAPMIFNKVN